MSESSAITKCSFKLHNIMNSDVQETGLKSTKCTRAVILSGELQKNLMGTFPNDDCWQW